MSNCCDDYGNCRQGRDCPVRRVNSVPLPLQQKQGGKRVDTDLPITMADDGFFDTVDRFIVAARWVLAAAAVLCLGAFALSHFFK